MGGDDLVLISVDDLARAYIAWAEEVGDEDTETAIDRARYLFWLLKQDPLNTKRSIQ